MNSCITALVMTSPFGKGGLRGILWKNYSKNLPSPLFTKEGIKNKSILNMIRIRYKLISRTVL